MNINQLKEKWLLDLLDKGSKNTNLIVNKLIRHDRSHYIGMSSTTDCMRKIRAIYDRSPDIDSKRYFSDQILRVFDLGHIIEEVTINYLRANKDVEVTGTQTEFKDHDDILKGHCDAILNNQYIIEIKSANSEKAEEFSTKKLIDFNLTYYNQLQLYLHYSGLSEGFLVLYDKNNSKYHTEHVSINLPHLSILLNKLSITCKVNHYLEIPLELCELSKCKSCELKSKCRT